MARPTLTELLTRILAGFDSRLPEADPRLDRSIENEIASIVQGASHEIHGSIARVELDAFPHSASEAPLLRHGRRIGVDRDIANPAAGTATATGTNGVEIPSGVILQDGNGVEYETTTAETISTGSATLNLEAVVAASAGNAATGVKLSFASPIPGVESIATVDAPGLTGGADAEELEAYRTLVLTEGGKPAQGGNSADWDRWVDRDSPLDVTRFWVTAPPAGMDIISVSFVLDNSTPIIPTAADITALAAYLETRKVVGSTVSVGVPTLETIDPEIQLNPDTSAIRAAVQAELDDLIYREASPGGTILISHIREAISIAPGEGDHVLVSPAADITPGAAENLFEVGTITWS